MLVCSVSLRARRTLAGDIAEAAAALDNADTPGLGHLVSELANANAIVNAALSAGAAIAEAAAAADASAGVLAGGIMASVAEAVAATSAQDSAIIAATVGIVAEVAAADSAQDASVAVGTMPWAFDLFQQGRWLTVTALVIPAVSEVATAVDAPDAITVAAVATSAVLEGAFVDPQAPATLLGTEVLDSGPATVFKP